MLNGSLRILKEGFYVDDSKRDNNVATQDNDEHFPPQSGKQPPKFGQVIDMNRLASCVIETTVSQHNENCSKVSGKVVDIPLDTIENMRDILMSFCVVCFAFGGDYLDGFQNITAQTIISAYLDNLADIGCLTYMDNEKDLVMIKEDAMTRLLLHATCTAYSNVRFRRGKGKHDEEENDQNKNNNKNGKRTSVVCENPSTKRIKPSLVTATRLLSGQNLKFGKDYMTPVDFSNRILRILWYVNYIYSMSVRLQPEHFGYKLTIVNNDDNTTSRLWDFC
jgi:hypothetical protein